MAKPINLDDLLRAIHNAVISAQQITEQQHIRQLRNYFEWPEGSMPADSQDLGNFVGGKARTWEIQVPDMRPTAGPGDTVPMRVPIMSLVPPSAIRIENMIMEFQANINGFTEEEPQPTKARFTPVDPTSHRGPVSLDLNGSGKSFFGGKKGNPARIKIEFKAGDPSEAFLRINDQLIKSIT